MTTTRPTDEHDALRAALVKLTPAQATAADALATGSTHAEAAETAGVTRETVTRWSNHHPGFREALDRYRHALAIDAANAAVRIRGKALAVVERHLDAGSDDLNAALAVLRAVPAPDLDNPSTANEHLAAETQRLAETVPPPPAPRGANGRISREDNSFDCIHDTQAEDRERADAIALEMLADAAGIDVTGA